MHANDFWTLSNGPYGAVVNSVCEAPNGNLLAGTASGLYYSTNKGNSWSLMNFAGKYIYSITISDSGKIYVAMIGDLELSKDNGKSWTRIDGGFSANFKIIHPCKNGRTYIIAHSSHQYNKLYQAISDEGGWSQISTSINLIQSFDIKPSNGYFFIGTFNDGIYRSTDYGENITKVGLDTLSISTIMIDSSGNIYAGSLDHGLYLSSNNGDNWSFLGLEGNSIYAISKNSSGHIYCGTLNNGIMKSTDSGNSWTRQNSGLINNQALSIYTDKENKVFLGLNGDGVFYSDNNASNWNYSSDGLESSQTNALVINNSGRIFAGTNGAGMWYTDNHGNNWVRCNNGLDTPNIYKLAKNSQGDIYAGSYYGAIFRSSNNGSNWTKIRNSSSPAQLGGLVIDDNDNIYVTITNNGVFKSTNNGNDWTNIGLNDKVHRSLLVINDSILLVGTYSYGLFRTSDNGVTWTHPNTMSSTIYAISKDEDNNIYLGGSMGQFEKSTNSGLNWTLTNNLNQQVNDISCANNGKIFAGLDANGIRVSLDYGQTWDAVNSGLKSLRIYDIEINPDDVIFAALKEGVYTNSEMMVDLDAPILSSPKNNEYGVNPDVVFSWNQVEDASEYQFQLSDDANFTNILDYATISTTSRIADYSFDYATKYYWRVRAKQNISLSDWSEVWSFTTNIESPVPILPLNNSEDINLPVNFIWNSVEGASSYTLLISDESDFSRTISMNEVIVDTSFIISELDHYTDYYWKVQAVGLGATSEWSEISKFSTNLAPPKLTYPVDNASGLNAKVECKWDIVAHAVKYIIELASESDFNTSSIIYSGETSSLNSHTFTLNYGKRFFWHVKSKTSKSESQWSEVRTFSTGLKAPNLLSPGNSSDNMNIPVTFKWEEYTDAEKYYIEISTDYDFKNIIFFDSNINGVEISVNNLEFNKKYYWRLKVLVNDIYSFWSESRSFSTGLMPPTLISPNNSEASFTIPFKLCWSYSDSDVGYFIEISSDENFSNILISDSVFAVTTYNINLLEFFETYYWRVRAKIADKYSLWSNVWFFTTSLNKPALSYPADYSENHDLNIEFSWLPVLGSEFYEMQISFDDIFDNPSNIIDSVFDIGLEMENFSYNKKYYWRLRAKNGKGESQWSDIWNFVTKKEPNDVEESFLYDKIRIYPNPFTDNTNIELQSDGNIKLVIYNLLGYEVDSFTIYAKNYENKTVCYNGKNLSPGYYFLRICKNNEFLSGNTYYLIKE
jgi:photosystem II stability/assembly factor-like uncharacterized protein